jgi:7-keto-8-aminopelargonate synthetase-like enzyme
MAKINHNNSLDTIDELLTDAKQRGIIHLTSDLVEVSDRKLNINGRQLLNFGTCGYLGLELDERLKEGAIDFIRKFGTQFGISRTYLSSGINVEMEHYLSQMYDGRPVITYSSTSSGHVSVIPTLINYDDAIILDQQVHMSIQTASQLLRQKGVPVEMIRHSNMEMLERQLEHLSPRHKNIWYMVDGVYSMYGDVAPMDQLLPLLEKYEQLHIYIDDAHGMSWHGKNGTGYINSQMPIHDRIMLMTTMGKGFGVVGGIAVFPTEEMFRRVRIFGGPLTYSHPITPPIIGAAIASAKIHLSDEIYSIQNELKQNMDYCNELMAKTDLTMISNPSTPIFFIGMGQPKVGYNMVNRMLNDGFFVNLALFPAVSVKNTGIRFSMSRQVNKEEIRDFVNALSYHYPKALEEEGRTMEDVRKAFKLAVEAKEMTHKRLAKKPATELLVQMETTAKNLDEAEWNKLLGHNGTFDVDGLLSLEDVFSNNDRPEENWSFYYFIIRDKDGTPVVATFFSEGISKDDMMAQESVSLQIEEKRRADPYYLTSKTLTMGSMLSEGRHCYINKKSQHWQKAVLLLLENVYKIKEEHNINTLLLRDFDKDDQDLKDLLLNEGFVPLNMPNSNVIENAAWHTKEELLNEVTIRNKRHIKFDVFKHEHAFELEYKKEITEEEAEHFYKLYCNVELRNKAFNMFPYPKTILKKLSAHPGWEFIVLKLKPGFDKRAHRKAVAVAWCYKAAGHYVYMIVGIDYDYNAAFKVYKQAMYQVVQRARNLNLSQIYLGLSADFEKGKYGAKQHARVAYLQVKDNFNMEVIESMSASVTV